MLIRDINFYLPPDSDLRGVFVPQSYCVALHYLDVLGRVETKGIGKFVVEPVSENPGVKQLLNIVEVRELFDFDAYNNLKTQTDLKKKMTLELLHSGALRAASYFGWDKKPFDDAYQKVLVENIEYKRYWGKPVSSPDRKHKAQIFYFFDLTQTIFDVVFGDRSGDQILQTRIHEVRSGWVDAYLVFGSFRWVSNTEIQLISRDGGTTWFASLNV